MDTLTLQPDGTAGLDAPIINGAYASNNYQNFTLAALGSVHALGTTVLTRLVISFDLSSLPAHPSIHEARLTLYSDGSGSTVGTATFNCYRLSRTNWTEAGVTWNRYDGTNNWTTAGGDYVTTNAVTGTAQGSATSLEFSDLGPMIDDALDAGLTRLHLLLVGPEVQGVTNYYNALTSETATAAERPRLEIDYSTSVFNQCLYAAKDVIEALELPPLSTQEGAAPEVVVRKIQADHNLGRDKDVTLPAIILSPFREFPMPDKGVNGKNDIHYGVACVIMAADNREATVKRDIDRILVWRQQIFRAFHNQRLSAVDEIINAFVDPASVTMPPAYKDNLLTSPMLLRFHSREAMTN